MSDLRPLSDVEKDLCGKCYQENGNNCIQHLDGPEVPDDFLHNCTTLKGEVKYKELKQAFDLTIKHVKNIGCCCHLTEIISNSKCEACLILENETVKKFMRKENKHGYDVSKLTKFDLPVKLNEETGKLDIIKKGE